ncbi:TetR/AcrR family transcriptional regulator [Microbacterium sp. 3J1]|uniref:TetR/AcrR family transcriptional regulator n=1 Tax=Microbacterium sp. 3J1 TaxID=861269 RepID=UPI000A99F4FB|nr:TetR/AcrR family transcriptional regulator [Microbacterium sp. 3J1]
MPADSIRLNDIARETGLGVGTVYRHFPTVIALLEALNLDALAELADRAHEVAASESPGAAFVELVKRGAELQIARDGLKEVLISDDVSAEVRDLRDSFRRSATIGLAAAVAEGRVRSDITLEQIQRLVCGVEYAVRLGDGLDRPLLLDVMIAGLEGARR